MLDGRFDDMEKDAGLEQHYVAFLYIKKIQVSRRESAHINDCVCGA